METNLILEGFKFMGLGMGTVFLFLILTILSMKIMSAFIHRFLPEAHQDSNVVVKKQDNKKIIAAITAAITHHRQG